MRCGRACSAARLLLSMCALAALALCTARVQAVGAAVSCSAVVALADMHGDLGAAMRALALAGVASAQAGAAGGQARASAEWVGGGACLVQTGDQVDRGADSLLVVEMLESLREQAAAAGGEVTSLLGNHELMSLAGDTRYVAREELDELGARGGSRAEAQRALEQRLAAPDGEGQRASGGVRAGKQAWSDAWAPGGEYFALATQRPVAVIRGEGACRTLFVHAGVLPAHVQRYGELAALNEAMGAAVARARSRQARQSELLGNEGPVWTRVYAEEEERVACAALEEVLRATGAARMVVGHTVQRPVARARCGGRLVLLDTGASAIYRGHPSAFRCDQGEEGGAWLLREGHKEALPRVEPMQQQGGQRRSEL